jgi:PIN domain nuclease of toxin-antitoxin system
MASAPERLSARARSLVEASENDLYMSAASAWEIAIKHSLGKLQLPEPPTRYVPSRLERMGVVPLSIEHAHALRVGTLPRHHRDPFDRLLIAQSQIEGMPVLTGDPVFSSYDVVTIPA